MSVKSPGIRYRCSSNTGSNHLMIEAIRSATSYHVSRYVVDEPINNVALTPSSSLSGAFTFQYVAQRPIVCLPYCEQSLLATHFHARQLLIVAVHIPAG